PEDNPPADSPRPATFLRLPCQSTFTCMPRHRETHSHRPYPLPLAPSSSTAVLPPRRAAGTRTGCVCCARPWLPRLAWPPVLFRGCGSNCDPCMYSPFPASPRSVGCTVLPLHGVCA
ncbi:unnamed protein product, partial [Ectocarpus sp. 8 AP-2014]